MLLLHSHGTLLGAVPPERRADNMNEGASLIVAPQAWPNLRGAEEDECVYMDIEDHRHDRR